MVKLPGTTLVVESVPEEGAFAALAPVFSVLGGGLTLSQVAELSGVYGTTIQNWVKRGWVESPQNKKYLPRQVARVLLINLLRPTMRLEQIITLMTYINGRVDDQSDDILPDEELYSIVSGLVLALEQTGEVGGELIHAIVRERLADFTAMTPAARDKLSKALEAILLNICAARLMHQAQALYTEIGMPQTEDA